MDLKKIDLLVLKNIQVSKIEELRTPIGPTSGLAKIVEYHFLAP